MRVFLLKSIDFNSKDIIGLTQLMNTCINGQTHVVKLLFFGVCRVAFCNVLQQIFFIFLICSEITFGSVTDSFPTTLRVPNLIQYKIIFQPTMITSMAVGSHLFSIYHQLLAGRAENENEPQYIYPPPLFLVQWDSNIIKELQKESFLVRPHNFQ